MEGNVAVNGQQLPPSTGKAIALVRAMEDVAAKLPQVGIVTEHVLHGGIYTRTICVPAGAMITGALIKIPTTLTISGHAAVIIGDGEEVVVDGHMVAPASAGRKQMFLAYADTYISMSFRTDAKTVEDAEGEFTDETALLLSRQGENRTVITGE